MQLRQLKFKRVFYRFQLMERLKSPTKFVESYCRYKVFVRIIYKIDIWCVKLVSIIADTSVMSVDVLKTISKAESTFLQYLSEEEFNYTSNVSQTLRALEICISRHFCEYLFPFRDTRNEAFKMQRMYEK